MFSNLQDPVGPFSLIMLQREFQCRLRPHDRYYSPASPLKHRRVWGGYCLFDIERFSEQVLLAGEPSCDGVLDSMPSDIVRVKFLQPVAFGVDEGCAVGSLHPLVHPAYESVNSVLSSVYREDT